MIKILPMILLLAGCSTLADYWPTPHDPALAQGWVQVRMEIERVNCDDRSNWQSLLRNAEFVSTYADFRSDNQRRTAAGLLENLTKAQQASNPRVCVHNLNLAKTRLDILKTAWSGR